MGIHDADYKERKEAREWWDNKEELDQAKLRKACEVADYLGLAYNWAGRFLAVKTIYDAMDGFS